MRMVMMDVMMDGWMDGCVVVNPVFGVGCCALLLSFLPSFLPSFCFVCFFTHQWVRQTRPSDLRLPRPRSAAAHPLDVEPETKVKGNRKIMMMMTIMMMVMIPFHHYTNYSIILLRDTQRLI